MKYIYCMTNLINGKNYIGKRDCKNILPENDTNYNGSGIHLNRSIIKYGIENFKKDIIIMGDFSKEEINEYEKYYISLYKLGGKAEYNHRPGGDGGTTYGHLGKKHSLESRLKMSTNKNGNCFRGKHHSEHSKKEISFSTKIGMKKARKNGKQIGRLKGSIPYTKDKICINNDKKNKFINKNEVNLFILNGWKIGMLKKKSSESGERLYITNGIINKHIKKDQFNEYIIQGFRIGQTCKDKI